MHNVFQKLCTQKMNDTFSVGEGGRCATGHIECTSFLIGSSMLHAGTNTMPAMYSKVRFRVYVIVLMKVQAGFTGLLGHYLSPHSYYNIPEKIMVDLEL